ncbi:hypothetical protein C809_00157 [Lachnospiraceae bacterium MD335]|nr:hypothetical protein C809_00157 [Lachnospiraceae bacterium MD335]
MSKRGENIYKRKDGRWEGRYIKAYDGKKPKYGYVYAKTYKSVKEKLIVAREAAHNILYAQPAKDNSEDFLFENIALSWLGSIRPKIKKSTLVKYTNSLNSYIIPSFGNYPIQDISRTDVESFCSELLVSGGKKGNGLAPKTVSDIFSVIKNLFEYAEDCKELQVANIRNIIIKQTAKTMRVLSMLEQERLDVFLRSNVSYSNLSILLSLYTGIRIGELCALKWGDIDFENQCLIINKTLQRIQNIEADLSEPKTILIITTPKSICSIRKIPLPTDIYKLILEYKCGQDKYFTTGTEHYIEPRTMENRFNAVLKRCNINKSNFHALRHTFATRCIELGFDTKSLSEILGHANVNITLNRYVHPSMEVKKKNMNMLSDLFAVK